jgi:hypothetical protein
VAERALTHEKVVGTFRRCAASFWRIEINDHVDIRGQARKAMENSREPAAQKCLAPFHSSGTFSQQRAPDTP